MTQVSLSAALRGSTLLAAGVCCGAGAWTLAQEPVSVAARPLRASGLQGLDLLPFDAALLAVCAVLLLCCVLWLLVTTTVAVTAYVVREVVPHSRSVAPLCRVAEATCPAAVRRLVAMALGVAITATVTAAPAPAALDAGRDPLAGLALPDRPTGSGLAVAASRTVAPSGGGRDTTRQAAAPHTRDGRPVGPVVVRPGQSLWSICADLLPSEATDQEITRAWHRLHRANAARIGSDPDLIQPGTRLVVPHLTSAPHREEAP